MRQTIRSGLLLLAGAALVAVGCNGGDGTDAGRQDAGPPLDGQADAQQPDYPPRPYGYTVGNIVEDHAFFGLQGGSDELQLVSFGDLYRDENVELLLINVSAGWCVFCAQEALELEVLYNEYGSRGLAILTALFEDRQRQPADEDFIRYWRDEYNLTFWVVIDDSEWMLQFFEESSTPLNMFIQTSNMEIVWWGVGDNLGVMRNQINQRLSP